MWVSLLLRVSPFIIAQHIHERNMCQLAEFICHKPTSKATSALLITWCSVSTCHITNSFFLINPNLRLIRAICRKEGRQLLVSFAATVVFAWLRRLASSNTASSSCLTKTDRGVSCSENVTWDVPVISVSGTTNTPVGYESDTSRPFPRLWIPFLILVFSKEKNKCEGNMTSHSP